MMAGMDDIDRTLISGSLNLSIYLRGTLIEEWAGNNLILDSRRYIHSRLLGGAAGFDVDSVGFGENGTPPQPGNTQLLNWFSKPVDGVSFPSEGRVEFAFSLAANEANGMAIHEFGLLTSSGILYARKTRGSPLIKIPDLALSGRWLITFA